MEDELPRKRKARRVPIEDYEPDPEFDLPSVAGIEALSTALSVSGIELEAQKLLKMSTFEPQHKYWLDTKSEQVNATLGSRSKGLAYGKIIELAGPNHGGKTAMSTILAGLAQQEGAGVQYMDLENSRDKQWAGKLGLDLDNTVCLYPKLIVTRKEAMPMLQSSEQLFELAETNMYLLQKRGFEKQCLILDSIAQIQTSKVIEAGTTGQNMRTKVDRAMFLSDTLPKWAGLAANYNVLILLVNQIRTKVGVMFGNPEYSPGGNALIHACAIRARVARVSNGHLRKNGKVIGIVGKIKNVKNKAGEGSVEGEECGFKIRWSTIPAHVEFMTKEEAEALVKVKGEE